MSSPRQRSAHSRKAGAPEASEAPIAQVQASPTGPAQPKKSAKQGTADPKGNTNKRARDMQREKTKQEKKQLPKTEQARKKAEQDLRSKREGHVRLFDLAFKNGNSTVGISQVDFLAGVANNLTGLTRPHVISDREDPKAVNSEKKVPAKTLESWAVCFRGAAQCKGPDKRTQAPLVAAAGLPESDKIFSKYLPPNSLSCAGHPMLSQAVAQTWLFGYMPDMQNALAEPGGMGTLKAHIGGQCVTAVVDAGSLHKYLSTVDGVYGDKNKPSILEMLAWFQDMDQASLGKAEAAGLEIWHALVPELAIVYMPPGYIVAVKAVNSKHVFGLRRSFVMKDPTVKEAIRVLQLSNKGAGFAEDAKRLEELPDIVEHA
jgi:hypothetical protein